MLMFENYADLTNIEWKIDREANCLAVDVLDNKNLAGFVESLKFFAMKHKLSKISVRVRESDAIYFYQHGYQIESSINGFYGLQDAFYLAYFIEDEQVSPKKEAQLSSIVERLLAQNETPEHNNIDEGILIEKAAIPANKHSKQHIEFSSRVHDSELDAYEESFVAKVDESVAATATAYYREDLDIVEFGNYKVFPSANIKKITNQLVNTMQAYYAKLGCNMVFTHVPASSSTINEVFAVNDFEYGGRLTNEVIHQRKLDSLNTWFKQINA